MDVSPTNTHPPPLCSFMFFPLFLVNSKFIEQKLDFKWQGQGSAMMTGKQCFLSSAYPMRLRPCPSKQEDSNLFSGPPCTSRLNLGQKPIKAFKQESGKCRNGCGRTELPPDTDESGVPHLHTPAARSHLPPLRQRKPRIVRKGLKCPPQCLACTRCAVPGFGNSVTILLSM